MDQRDNTWRPSSEGIEAGFFEDVIADGPAIVHFWAPWNPYDRQLDAHVQAVRGEFEKRFRFYSVNADETAFSKVIELHHVAALPALLCLVNGRVRGRFHGVQTVEELRGFLEEMAKGPRR